MGENFLLFSGKSPKVQFNSNYMIVLLMNIFVELSEKFKSPNKSFLGVTPIFQAEILPHSKPKSFGDRPRFLVRAKSLAGSFGILYK